MSDTIESMDVEQLLVPAWTLGHEPVRDLSLQRDVVRASAAGLPVAERAPLQAAAEVAVVVAHALMLGDSEERPRRVEEAESLARVVLSGLGNPTLDGGLPELVLTARRTARRLIGECLTLLEQARETAAAADLGLADNRLVAGTPANLQAIAAAESLAATVTDPQAGAVAP